MGGCCCCASKGPNHVRTPAYYYCPRVSEESELLSANNNPTGFLVDTNLDTSIPDTYRPPPAPIPYDVDLGRPQTPPNTQFFCGNKTNASVQSENSESIEATVTSEASAKCDGLNASECKVESDSKGSLEKHIELEFSMPLEPLVSSEEEVSCPTCFEEYDAENPKIITKCEHHFHLACILEWMERSDTCPVCDKEMMFSPPRR